MALTKCKECGSEVSTKADACPKCGAKVKRTSATTKIVGGILVAAVIGAALNGGHSTTGSSSAMTASAPAKDPVRDAQLTRAGNAALALKNASKDPESFELKSAVVKADGSTCYHYRATNSFGAHLAGDAILTKEGTLLLHEHDGNRFVAAWNKVCTKDGGDDIVDYLKMLHVV